MFFEKTKINVENKNCGFLKKRLPLCVFGAVERSSTLRVLIPTAWLRWFSGILSFRWGRISPPLDPSAQIHRIFFSLSLVQQLDDQGSVFASPLFDICWGYCLKDVRWLSDSFFDQCCISFDVCCILWASFFRAPNLPSFYIDL